MIRLRHTDEWVGLLVVAAVAIFISVALQAGVLRDWFRPASTLRIMLPAAGVAGLSEGADVEVLGTRAGTVRRVVIDPSQQMYAEAEIDDQARAFIRRDSAAVIRRRFGVAGATFVDITRGTGAQLDWSFAVIQAETERAPTESVGALIDQLREKVFPVLDDAGRAMHALADTMERIEKGEGNVGRLMVDDTLIRSVEGTAADARAAVSDARQVLAQLQTAANDIRAITGTASAKEGGVPELLQRADQALTTLQGSINDLSVAARRLPQIARNVESGTANLPSVLTQAQQTARRLEELLVQLRGAWLLGGGGPPPPTPASRLSPTEVRP
ncbi:MAG TPA: MlaD family protein [Methylomirabilota bacterium]|nr:MlaD family protein [Methylomirabilota bacterium]